MTNMEDNLYDAANALYQLYPEGDFSYLPSQYRWMEVRTFFYPAALFSSQITVFTGAAV